MFSLKRNWNACAIGWLPFSLILLCLPAFAQSGKESSRAPSPTIPEPSSEGRESSYFHRVSPAARTIRANLSCATLRQATTLSATYIGFKTRNEEVDVVANKTLNLDLRLEVTSRGEEVDVSASRFWRG